jgi:hypothetical protein
MHQKYLKYQKIKDQEQFQKALADKYPLQLIHL